MTAINRSASPAVPNTVTTGELAGLDNLSNSLQNSTPAQDPSQASQPPVYRATTTEASARKAEANMAALSQQAHLNSQLATRKAEGKQLISMSSAVKGYEREVNKQMLDQGAEMLRKAKPKQDDDVIYTLGKLKSAVEENHGLAGRADFNAFLHQNHENLAGILGPFGYRQIAAPGTAMMEEQIANFDRAVQRWQNMSPTQREQVRNIHDPAGNKLRAQIAMAERPGAAETEAKQGDQTKILTKLPDGRVYSGEQRKLKDAQEVARNNQTLEKMDGLISSGPVSLLGRVVGGVSDGLLGTQNMSEKLAALGSLGDAVLPGAAKGSMKARTPETFPTTPGGKPSVSNSGSAPQRRIASEEQPRSGDPWAPKPNTNSNNGAGKPVVDPHASTNPGPPPKSNTNAPKSQRTVDTSSPSVQPKPNQGPQARKVRPFEQVHFVDLPRGERPAPDEKIRIRTPKGLEIITVAEYANRREAAEEWTKQSAHEKWGTKGEHADHFAEFRKQAETKFGLQKSWYFMDSNPVLWKGIPPNFKP